MNIKQMWRVALAASAFVGFGIGGALLSWIVLPLLSLDTCRPRRQRRCQRVVHRAFVLFHDYMRICGLVAYDPRAVERSLPDGPLLLVPNHPTLVDVTALIAAYGELCVVAKRSLFRNPLIGPLLCLCGHIQGAGRTSGMQRSGVVEQAVDRLRQGHRVLMFPEGGRSPAHGLRRFHAGPFQVALAARVPLVPVAITAEPPGLKKHQAWYQIPLTPIELAITALPAVVGGPGVTARELQLEAQLRIKHRLELSTPEFAD
jgi:1-acyl-sn-glycerol-3-phosphate acyltransferase